MKKITLYIIMGIIVLLPVACGQQHQAKSVIQDFVEQFANEPSAYSSITIVKFDSTRVLSDSVIEKMRANADTVQRYDTKRIKYADGPKEGKLFVARIKYSINGDDYSETYYLDDQLTHVIAFKTN